MSCTVLAYLPSLLLCWRTCISNSAAWLFATVHLSINPLSTRPHQDVVWYNNSWLGFLKILNYVPKEREKYTAKKWALTMSQLNVATAHRNYFRRNNLRILNFGNIHTFINRLKIHYLGPNWQLFRLERIAKFSYFILSTQNIKFHWIVMKIKKFLLPIWWYDRDLFPRSNKYNVVFVLNGLNVTAQNLNPLDMFLISCSKDSYKMHPWRWQDMILLSPSLISKMQKMWSILSWFNLLQCWRVKFFLSDTDYNA